MPYIHFTEEQKRQANRVNPVEFLRFKGEPLTRSGRELRMERNHSVTVHGNEWYDHAAEKGGGPVSFLKEFYGMNYQQVVLTLLNEDISQLCSQVDTPREKERKTFVLPSANENNRRVFAYLLKHRHLDRDVLTTFIRLGLIYEDQKYHNAVFVGRDKDGTARHVHKRSTSSQGKPFHMTVEGSDFRYTFNWPDASEHLLVFEAPIDMLSFISMHHGSSWGKHSYEFGQRGVAAGACVVSAPAALRVGCQRPTGGGRRGAGKTKTQKFTVISYPFHIPVLYYSEKRGDCNGNITNC